MRLFLVAMLAMSFLACGKHVHTKEDLDHTLSRHLINLRWGRLQNAAQAMQPELRAAFVETWTALDNVIDVQDLEVVALSVDESGDIATVSLRVVYVDKRTMRVSTETVSQKWLRDDDGWHGAEVVSVGDGFGG